MHIGYNPTTNMIERIPVELWPPLPVLIVTVRLSQVNP